MYLFITFFFLVNGILESHKFLESSTLLNFSKTFNEKKVLNYTIQKIANKSLVYSTNKQTSALQPQLAYSLYI